MAPLNPDGAITVKAGPGSRAVLVWGVATIALLLFAMVGMLYGWPWALSPIVLLVCAISFLWPRAGVFVLTTLIYFRYSLPGTAGIYAADVMAFVVIGSVLLQRLVHGKRLVLRTWANVFLFWILVVLAVSLTTAYDLGFGLKNWMRHAQLFGLIVTIVSCIERRDIFLLTGWMLALTAIFSAGNIITYVLVGGQERVFGPTAVFFATFVVLAALHSAVGFLMSRSRLRSLGWGALLGLYVLGLVVAQTRAAMIQLVLAIGILFVVVWYWGWRSRQSYLQWRVLMLTTAVGFLGVVILADWVPLLHSPAARIEEVLQGHAHTVDLRMFLWKTGLRAFSESPIIGIGLGQVERWDQFLPYWRFDISSTMTRGLGAHNDFITYIAETGILGMIPILWFLWRLFASGGKALRRALSHREATEVMMLWVPVAAIVISFFFRTHMFYSIAGILTSLYFAFWIRYSSVDDSVGVREAATADPPAA